MTIIKNVLSWFKEKWEEFIRDFWLFHPVLAFGLYLRPIVEISTKQYSTGEAIGLAFSLCGLNIFFWLMWCYRKHLIKKEEDRNRKNRERLESFDKKENEIY